MTGISLHMQWPLTKNNIFPTEFFIIDPRFAHGRSDGAGKESKLSLWNYAGDDLCGIVAR
jgi:hypothetical protein